MKSENKVTPTKKQKDTYERLVELGGNNVGKAMVMAGYSKNTAKTPQKLTESKGWHELMEEYLPDSLLGEKHRELLTVPRKVRQTIKGDLVYEEEEVDSQAISKGLDMAYKLKGKYAPDKNETTIILPKPILDGLAKNHGLHPDNGNQEASET